MVNTIWGILGIFLAFAMLGACGGGGGGGGNGGGGGQGTPGPTLTSLTPSSVQASNPAFTLTVNGTGFQAGGSLTWNNSDLGPYTFVSSTQVTVSVGARFVLGQGSATIVATNVSGGTSPSNALTFTINPYTKSACVLFGSYDFFFTGFDSTGPVTEAGAIGIDANGNVSGEVDFKNRLTARPAQPVTGGMCTNSANTNEGTLTITTAAGTSAYEFATQGLPVPGIRGRLAESGGASGISGSGRFVYTPANSGFFTGDYVIALVGADASGHRMGVVGRFTDTDANNTTGTLSNGIADINDNGTITASATITGSVATPDANSRALATLTIDNQTYRLAFYVLGPQAGFAVDVDAVGSGAVLAGLVSSQPNAGLYSNDNLNAPVVFSTWGVVPGTTATSNTAVGLASAFDKSAGTLSLQLDAVAGGVASSNQTVPGLYSIASTGRGTLSYLLGGISHNLVFYLDGNNDGYLLQSDTAGSVDFGFFEAQANVAFTNALINGVFAGGTWFGTLATSPNTAAQFTFSNGNISATTAGGPLTGTYTVSPTGRGTGTLTQPVFGSNNIVFYVIGSGAIEVMGADPVIGQGDAISFLHH